MVHQIHSYPKVYNIPHPNIDNLFDGPVVVQEKLDGSQFSFMWDEDGLLHARSKGKVQLNGPDGIVDTDNMFLDAVNYLTTLPPVSPGVVFRAELFNKPKHNSLTYDSVPKNGLALFDVETTPDTFVSTDDHFSWAEFLGIGTTVTYHVGELDDPEFRVEFLEKLLDQKPVLGGHMIEGIVVKNYNRFGIDGKILTGKYVAPQFRELHDKEWKKTNPTKTDIIQQLGDALNTENRWMKAIQHLREAGQLEGTPRDIGILMKEIKSDVLAEEEAFINEQVMRWVTPQLNKHLGRGFPEWYKEKLFRGEIGF